MVSNGHLLYHKSQLKYQLQANGHHIVNILSPLAFQCLRLGRGGVANGEQYSAFSIWNRRQFLHNHLTFMVFCIEKWSANVEQNLITIFHNKILTILFPYGHHLLSFFSTLNGEQALLTFLFQILLNFHLN